jgi:hydrogenase nickel incorporation protein HypA/HybF
MHELALMGHIVEAIEERTRPARVVRVSLQIGRLSGAVPDALRFCFDACTRDTALEGAELVIREIPGRALCRDCGEELLLDSFLDLCTCGSASLDVVAGQELRIQSVEVS